jgi:hypothetical protein
VSRTGKDIGINSRDLPDDLTAEEESPTAEWRRGHPIMVRGIAKPPKAFGIHQARDGHGRFYRTGVSSLSCSSHSRASFSRCSSNLRSTLTASIFTRRSASAWSRVRNEQVCPRFPQVSMMS